MAPIMTNSNKSIKYAFFGCTSVTLPVGKADISKCEFETFDPKGVQKTITNTLDVGYDRVKNIL